MPPQQPLRDAAPAAEPAITVRHNSAWKSIAIVAIVVIFVLLGAIGYLFSTQQNEARTATEKNIALDDSQIPMSTAETLPQFDKNGIAIVAQGSTTLLTDSRTGISFSFPSEWGRVSIDDERGECSPSTQDPCNQRIYLFNNGERDNIFLATETSGHNEHPVGRGGFWGDAAGGIRDSLPKDCPTMTNCTLIQNAEGTLIAKRMGVFEMGNEDSSAEKKSAYYVYSDKGPYYGIVLSASRFSEPGDAREKQFEDVVVASLKLSAH